MGGGIDSLWGARAPTQKQPPARTINVALDMSKSFDIVNIHKIKYINIVNTITKLTANYTRGRKACITFRNTFSQRQLQSDIPQ